MAIVSKNQKETKESRRYLAFGEAEDAGQFGLAADGDVATVVELFLQFQPLVVGVDDAVLVLGARLSCCGHIARR